MNRIQMNALALAVSLGFSAGAMAENMSNADYSTAKDKIATEYKSGKAACNSLPANAKDVCVAQAKGVQKVARADLDASYKPSTKAHYEARVAKAEADYGVAREKCDDLSGNAKDVCVKEAKAAETTAKADAKAQMKTANANASAKETSSDARSKASSEKADAR